MKSMAPAENAAVTPGVGVGAATPGRWAKAKGLSRCAERALGVQSQPQTPAEYRGVRAELSIAPTHRRPGFPPSGVDSAGSADSPPTRRARTRVPCPPTTPSPARFQSMLEFGARTTPRFSLTPPDSSPPATTPTAPLSPTRLVPPLLETEPPTPTDEGTCRRRAAGSAASEETPPFARTRGLSAGADSALQPGAGGSVLTPGSLKYARSHTSPPPGGISSTPPSSPAPSAWRDGSSGLHGCSSRRAQQRMGSVGAGGDTSDEDDELPHRTHAHTHANAHNAASEADDGSAQLVRGVLHFPDDGRSPVIRRYPLAYPSLSPPRRHSAAFNAGCSPAGRRLSLGRLSVSSDGDALNGGGGDEDDEDDGPPRRAASCIRECLSVPPRPHRLVDQNLGPSAVTRFQPLFHNSSTLASSAQLQLVTGADGDVERARSVPSARQGSEAPYATRHLAERQLAERYQASKRSPRVRGGSVPGLDNRSSLRNNGSPNKSSFRVGTGGTRGGGGGGSGGRASPLGVRTGEHGTMWGKSPDSPEVLAHADSPDEYGAAVLADLTAARVNRLGSPLRPPPLVSMGSLADTKLLFTLPPSRMSSGQPSRGAQHRWSGAQSPPGSQRHSAYGAGLGLEDASVNGGCACPTLQPRPAFPGFLGGDWSGALPGAGQADGQHCAGACAGSQANLTGGAASFRKVGAGAAAARPKIGIFASPYSPLGSAEQAEDDASATTPVDGGGEQNAGCFGAETPRTAPGLGYGAGAGWWVGSGDSNDLGSGRLSSEGGGSGGPRASTGADEFLFDEQFEYLHLLGSGSFSKVYRVMNRADGQEYAVKASKKAFRTRTERQLLLREVRNSQLLGEHPHIVKYFRAWQDQRSLYLQLELCEGGTLRSHVAEIRDGEAANGRPADLGERHVWALTAQLSSGLAHIHSHQLLHLDIKPENLLMTAHGELKIGDLGLCVSAEDWEEQEGDAVYIAPELLQSQPSTHCDIFSMGLVLYELATQTQLPTHAPSGSSAWHKLREGEISFPELPARSHELRDLILRCCKPNPRERPSAEEVYAIARACYWSNPAQAAGPAFEQQQQQPEGDGEAQFEVATQQLPQRMSTSGDEDGSWPQSSDPASAERLLPHSRDDSSELRVDLANCNVHDISWHSAGCKAVEEGRGEEGGEQDAEMTCSQD